MLQRLHACSELRCRLLNGQDAKALLAGDALTAELVVGREACGVGRLGGGAVWADLLRMRNAEREFGAGRRLFRGRVRR